MLAVVLDKGQVRRVLADVVVPVLLALELDDEGVRDAVLDLNPDSARLNSCMYGL